MLFINTIYKIMRTGLIFFKLHIFAKLKSSDRKIVGKSIEMHLRYILKVDASYSLTQK